MWIKARDVAACLRTQAIFWSSSEIRAFSIVFGIIKLIASLQYKQLITTEMVPHAAAGWITNCRYLS